MSDCSFAGSGPCDVNGCRYFAARAVQSCALSSAAANPGGQTVEAVALQLGLQRKQVRHAEVRALNKLFFYQRDALEEFHKE